MTALKTIGQLSPEAYFLWEETQDIRHEYYQGEVFAMAGTTLRHNAIIQNMIFGLRQHLKSNKCRIYSENIKVEVSTNSYYTYPDLVATCDPHNENDQVSVIKYPSLIAEILSQSTAIYDKGLKMRKYFGIKSLKYYILVSQNEYLAEVYERVAETDIWQLQYFEQLNDTITLTRLNNLQILMAQIYEDIDISPNETPEESDLIAR